MRVKLSSLSKNCIGLSKLEAKRRYYCRREVTDDVGRLISKAECGQIYRHSSTPMDTDAGKSAQSPQAMLPFGLKK